jgi:hypothetical protein
VAKTALANKTATRPPKGGPDKNSASKSDETSVRIMGPWTTEEDNTLKDAVKKHNGADWAAIAALVPGRTKKQCKGRWHNVLDSKSDETNARVGNNVLVGLLP